MKRTDRVLADLILLALVTAPLWMAAAFMKGWLPI